MNFPISGVLVSSIAILAGNIALTLALNADTGDGTGFTILNPTGGIGIVPEPGVLVSLLGGVGTLVGWQRFRRRK